MQELFQSQHFFCWWMSVVCSAADSQWIAGDTTTSVLFCGLSLWFGNEWCGMDSCMFFNVAFLLTQLCKNHSKSAMFFHGCRWYALRLIHNGSREIPSHRKLTILRFQEFLWQLLIDLDLVHRLVISDLLSWFIIPCRNHSKVSIVFFDVFRWYALRLIHNGSREIPPRWFCSAAYRYEWGMNDVEWIHVCSSMLLSPIYCDHFVLLVFLLVVFSAGDS